MLPCGKYWVNLQTVPKKKVCFDPPEASEGDDILLRSTDTTGCRGNPFFLPQDSLSRPVYRGEVGVVSHPPPPPTGKQPGLVPPCLK